MKKTTEMSVSLIEPETPTSGPARFARVVNGNVEETFDPTDDRTGEYIDITLVFPADVVSQFQECPDDVRAGWTFDEKGWTAPPIPPAPPVKRAMLTPMQFYLAFRPLERINIKASTAATVVEFWATFQMAFQSNTPVDPNLPSVTGGLQDLIDAKLIAPARVDDILNGVAQ